MAVSTQIPTVTQPPAFKPYVPRRSENRVLAGVMLAGSASVLSVALWLRPDVHGTGTHQQLGLPPCSLMTVTGIPCPTCGMTTSFSLAAHGHLWDAIVNQPAGGLLAIITAAIAIISLYSLITGVALTPIGAWVWRPRRVIVMGAFMLLAWAYKIYTVTHA